MTIILIAFLIFVIVALVVWVYRLKKSLKEHFVIERELQYEVGHDGLTDLVSATVTVDRLIQAIKNSQRYGHKIAVLYLGVDYFKQLNNASGFDISNGVLEQIAQKLLDNTDADDTVARVEGDEFVIILDNLENLSVIQSLIGRIMEIPKEPLQVKHHKIKVTFNVGISIYPNDNVEALTLLSHAYFAMYMVKDSITDYFKYYTPDLAEEAFKNEKLEHELVASIKDNQMEVFYQLQIDAKTQKAIGVEALARWKHPTVGLMLPEQFIGLGEEIGFIPEIDKWVMYEALAQFKKWKDAGYNLGNLSINLSRLRLEDKEFVEEVIAFIEEDASIKEYLYFEISEVQIMRNPTVCIEKLKELDSLGINIIVDDFGTELSSLAYLKKLPVKKLKIDRSFVKNLDENKAIIKTIISVAKNMSLDLIAEGVETQEQCDYFLQNGCSEIQGYLYSNVEPANVIEKKFKDFS